MTSLVLGLSSLGNDVTAAHKGVTLLRAVAEEIAKFVVIINISEQLLNTAIEAARTGEQASNETINLLNKLGMEIGN